MDFVQRNKSDMFDHLKRICEQAAQQGHRYLTVLSGDDEWLDRTLDSLTEITREALYVSASLSDVKRTERSDVLEVAAPTKVKQYLGQEYQHVIWDGRSGIHPEGLSAVSGVVKAGGLLILLLPNWTEFGTEADWDYRRMLGDEHALVDCSANFLSWLKQAVQDDPSCVLIRESHQLPKLTPVISPSKRVSRYPSSDQLRVKEAINKVAKGHRNRPLVVKADRGRGKSSVLGIASAELAVEGAQILITAPKQKACEQAFVHFDKEMRRLNEGSSVVEGGELRFIAPDELVHARPEANLVLVDEAAAIPVSILKTILQSYSRVVFSTTVHGYEGTGRGFAIRFQKTLQQLTPQWREVTMSEPVRWAEHDPLEAWTFKAFCLDAEIDELSALQGNSLESLSAGLQFEWIKQEDLVANSKLLTGVIGILVNAHYQTSPDDLRLILDHPDALIGMLRMGAHCIGAIVLLKEGNVQDEALAEGLINGTRRPRGHLVPQALAYSYADLSALSPSSLRVTRIAVHPELQGRGLGSIMISHAKAKAELLGVDYLSSSFAYESQVLAFWKQNEFECLRLGRSKDAASGNASVIVALPLNEPITEVFSGYKDSFLAGFLYDLPRSFKDLDVQCVKDLLGYLKCGRDAYEFPKLNKLIIQAYARGARQLADSRSAIMSVVLDALINGELESLEEVETDLLIKTFLQGWDEQALISYFEYTGRKALDKKLRDLVGSVA